MILIILYKHALFESNLSKKKQTLMDLNATYSRKAVAI